VVSHAGSALVALIADQTGRVGRAHGLRERRSEHDSGRVMGALAVMLADGGDCSADLGAVRGQDASLRSVASDSQQMRRSKVLVRADGAGATHELLDYCREHRLRYSVPFTTLNANMTPSSTGSPSPRLRLLAGEWSHAAALSGASARRGRGGAAP
jgi:hypothetical protein